MRTLLLAAALALVATGANATCKSDAADKNLRGAAKTSFISKCTREARTKCAAETKAQKLKGAAARSHTNKCVKAAVG